jgi:hypothetical protein
MGKRGTHAADDAAVLGYDFQAPPHPVQPNQTYTRKKTWNTGQHEALTLSMTQLYLVRGMPQRFLALSTAEGVAWSATMTNVRWGSCVYE